MTPQEIEKLFETAPEDCIGALVAKIGNVHYPKVTFASSMERKGCGFSGAACEGYGLSALECSWDWVDRPAQQAAWSGEGKPPVGAVCEAFYMGNPQGVVEVRYAGQCMILWSEDRKSEQCGQADDYWFKPTRSPEKIVTDERLAARAEMAEVTQGAHSWSEAFGMLHDAGYRKP